MSKVLSTEERQYYCKDIIKVLQFLSNGGKQASDIIRARHQIGLEWQLYDRPKLLQLLRTLAEDGLIKKVDLGMNWAEWEITDKGIELTLKAEKNDIPCNNTLPTMGNMDNEGMEND